MEPDSAVSTSQLSELPTQAADPGGVKAEVMLRLVLAVASVHLLAADPPDVPLGRFGDPVADAGGVVDDLGLTESAS
jgi:hypothetical protein